MVQLQITSILSLELHDCFMWFGDQQICLVVAVDGDFIYYYREDSDHLFRFRREHKFDVFFLNDAPE